VIIRGQKKENSTQFKIKNQKFKIISILYLLVAGSWPLETEFEQTNPIVNNPKHDNSLFHSWLLAAGRWPLPKAKPILPFQETFSRTTGGWPAARLFRPCRGLQGPFFGTIVIRLFLRFFALNVLFFGENIEILWLTSAGLPINFLVVSC